MAAKALMLSRLTERFAAGPSANLELGAMTSHMPLWPVSAGWVLSRSLAGNVRESWHCRVPPVRVSHVTVLVVRWGLVRQLLRRLPRHARASRRRAFG